MTTKTVSVVCSCGGTCTTIDTSGHSITVQCGGCQHASLMINHPRFQVQIQLADFHLKRGDHDEQRPLDDCEMASRLAVCLSNKEWPSAATCVDFGIASEIHYFALEHALRSGITVYDLDRVIGDGRAITQLVCGVPDQPFPKIEFQTPYDGFEAFDGGDF